jgi:hypothetical protein
MTTAATKILNEAEVAPHHFREATLPAYLPSRCQDSSHR